MAKGADLYSLGYQFDGSAHVVTGYLGMTYIWEKLRVQGGAYGGFTSSMTVRACFPSAPTATRMWPPLSKTMMALPPS